MIYKCNMKGCAAQATSTSLVPSAWLRLTIEGTGIMRYFVACDRHAHAEIVAVVAEALDTLPGRPTARKPPVRRAR